MLSAPAKQYCKRSVQMRDVQQFLKSLRQGAMAPF
jgi:hypothetical protein